MCALDDFNVGGSFGTSFKAEKKKFGQQSGKPKVAKRFGEGFFEKMKLIKNKLKELEMSFLQRS